MGGKGKRKGGMFDDAATSSSEGVVVVQEHYHITYDNQWHGKLWWLEVHDNGWVEWIPVCIMFGIDMTSPN